MTQHHPNLLSGLAFTQHFASGSNAGVSVVPNATCRQRGCLPPTRCPVTAWPHVPGILCEHPLLLEMDMLAHFTLKLQLGF